MVLESFAANCIGWLPPAFVSLMIDSASEVQGERRAELARCISNASAKVLVSLQISALQLGRFSAPIHAVFDEP